MLGVAAQRGEDRQQQEHVHRDEDREHAVPVDVDQQVLHRQHEVERRHQRRVVAAPGRGEGDELAQGVERHAIEQQDHRRLAKPEGETDHQDHRPPGVDPCVQVVDHRVRAGTGAPLEDEADQRGEQQQRADPAEEHPGLFVHLRPPLPAPGPAGPCALVRGTPPCLLPPWRPAACRSSGCRAAATAACGPWA